MANKKKLIVQLDWFVPADILLANGDERNLNLPKFARPPYFFSSSGFLALLLILLEENSQYLLYFSLQLFHCKM